tara:strand:- start:166 stop:564 length:399 start_codon:yes stop_codon:yes gene_type:complete
MRTQLLCTFSNIEKYVDVVTDLDGFYDIVYGKIYALQNCDDLDEILLTYNINADTLNKSTYYTDTISVHRKKDYNTIYTINSLNSLIKTLNNGVADSNFVVDWDDYKNSILLTDSSVGYKKIPTKLFKILNV